MRFLIHMSAFAIYTCQLTRYLIIQQKTAKADSHQFLRNETNERQNTVYL